MKKVDNVTVINGKTYRWGMFPFEPLPPRTTPRVPSIENTTLENLAKSLSGINISMEKIVSLLEEIKDLMESKNDGNNG